MATVYLVNGVYKLNIPKVLLATVIVSGDVWHCRLEHLSSNYLNSMLEAVEDFTFDSYTGKFESLYVVCYKGKLSA